MGLPTAFVANIFTVWYDYLNMIQSQKKEVGAVSEYVDKLKDKIRQLESDESFIKGNADKFDAGNNRVKYSRFVPNMV